MKLSEYGWQRLKTRFPIWITQSKTVIRREGIGGFVTRSVQKVVRLVGKSADIQTMHQRQYGEWVRTIDARYLNESYQEKILKELSADVKFSILFPTWNKSPEHISAAIESVLAQTYENWELCISDASTKRVDETEMLLKKYERLHPRSIKISFLREKLRTVPEINLIENTNNALSLATGEYCVFMDCDDELSTNCLLELAYAIKNNPAVKFLYSDFDKMDNDRNRYAPSFWPDWSPHSILSLMYTTHVTCYRKDVLQKLGGLKAGLVGAQDWDLVLRLRGMLSRKQVVHIPKILYHWRAYPDSTALPNSGAKDWAYEAQKKVLNDWIKNNHESATVEEGRNRINLRVKFAIKGKPKVTIIIPFRDNVKYLKRCLQSIFHHTDYENYEVLLVDNQSCEKSTQVYLKRILRKKYKVCRIVTYDHPYHFGRMNNWAASQSDAEHLLFLNNDTKVLTGEWLGALLEYSQRPEVACVGAKLLYPDKMVQHAGIIVGVGGAAAHSHRLVPNSYPGYHGWLIGVRNVLAVTAACMMIKRDLFFKLHGFDETFDPAYQDVDLGIRAYEAGYWNVYTSYSLLTHYESVTRMSNRNKNLLAGDEDMGFLLRTRWPQYIGQHFSGDPFYNPNLSTEDENFSIKTD